MKKGSELKSDMCLVIDPEGLNYKAYKEDIAKYLRVSEEQINLAIRTGHVLKGHYFDEITE